MVHVCWHRSTSVSMVDFSIAVEVRKRAVPELAFTSSLASSLRRSLCARPLRAPLCYQLVQSQPKGIRSCTHLQLGQGGAVQIPLS